MPAVIAESGNRIRVEFLSPIVLAAMLTRRASQGDGVGIPPIQAGNSMDNLSVNTRKSLCNQLGDMAGAELAEFLLQLKGRLEKMERTKVDRMPVVPDSPASSRGY